MILRLQSSQKLQKILKYLDSGIGQVEQTFSLPFTCQNLDSELFQMKTMLAHIQGMSKYVSANKGITES